jgi:hypothetical protein
VAMFYGCALSRRVRSLMLRCKRAWVALALMRFAHVSTMALRPCSRMSIANLCRRRYLLL